MQVYRGMDIGTAKPSAALRGEIVHRMIDVVDPSQPYSVAEFQSEGRAALAELAADGTPVIIVGGSGLHFRALVDPLEFPPTDPELRAELEASATASLVVELLESDPAAGAAVDLQNPRRVVRAVEILRLTGSTPSERQASEEARMVRAYTPDRALTAIGFDPGEVLRARIVERFDAMVELGLVEEVRSLGVLGPTASRAVGYKELAPFVAGEATLQEARTAAIAATASLAKRQRTFFRRDPRIAWLPWQDAAAARIDAALGAVEELSWIS